MRYLYSNLYYITKKILEKYFEDAEIQTLDVLISKCENGTVKKPISIIRTRFFYF